jgi:hypothetical protein
MPLKCPSCSSSGSLHITSSIELPYDSRSDEITLQVLRCSRCGFEGIAVYEESRRGGFDDESFSHTAYRVPDADLRRLERIISSCPRPKNPRCKCSAHRRLGRKGQHGRWAGLDNVELQYVSHLQI